MAYVTRTTHELREGDVVLSHGMRLLIDRPIETSRSHDNDGPGGACLYTSARLLNRAELSNDQVPYAWTRPRAEWVDGKGWTVPDHTIDDHRWTIQGNNFARWGVEIDG